MDREYNLAPRQYDPLTGFKTHYGLKSGNSPLVNMMLRYEAVRYRNVFKKMAGSDRTCGSVHLNLDCALSAAIEHRASPRGKSKSALH